MSSHMKRERMQGSAMLAASRPLAAYWLYRALAVTCLIVWFAGLGKRSLGEPDEGRYAEIAREMLVSGDWLTPRLDGFDFFDKPVLHYWATGLAYAVGGVHEWTARIWVALTGLLAIAIVGWAGTRLYGLRTGSTAALVLGSSLLFVAGGHINTMDMGVASFLSVAICLFLVAQFDPAAEPLRVRLNLLGWASLALAVLSKGLIGLVLPAMTLLLFMLWERNIQMLRRLSLGRGLLVVVILAAPWFIAISLKHADFFNYFFIKEHFGRFLTNEDDRGQGPWFFVLVVLIGLTPWLAFLPVSRSDWKSLYGGDRSERFLLCWIVVVLAFFTASHSKLPFYILPLFPALAMLIARRISAYSIRHLVWRHLGITLLGAGMAALMLMLSASTRHLSQHTDLHPLLIFFATGLAVLAGISAVGAIALVYGHRNLAVALLGLGALCVWQVLFANVGSIASDLSAKPVAQLMLPQLRKDTEVFTVHAYLRGLPFYLQRLVTVVDEAPADILPGQPSRPTGLLPDIDAFEKRWSAAPDAIAVIDPRLLPKLNGDGLSMQMVGTAPSGVVIRRPLAAQH